ncbi:MAG: radical SAM protein [Elusimicrobiota bacterium]
MIKAALVQCPVWWTVDPPLGLAQIAGCLGARGIETVVVDLNAELARGRASGYESLWNWEQFHYWNDPAFVKRAFHDNAKVVDDALERILRSDAAVVGFSVSAGSQAPTLEFARRIKDADSRRVIVLGGQYFFRGDAAARLAADPAVDAVLRGSGDELFPLLVEEHARTGRIEPCPGVVARADGAVVDGGSAEALRDLDLLPFADFRGFRLELYDVPERLPIHMSRGCVWQCRFCSSHSFWPGYSFMSGERVHDEMLEHKRRHPEKTHFEFYDLTANGSVKSLRRLAESIAADWKTRRQKNFFGWKINAIIRPEMDAELLGLLMKANCHDVIYGVESGSPRVLGLMNKPYEPSVAERVLADTKRAGIVTVGNFMFGFPGETEEDFGLTLEFLRRNRTSFDRVYASATFTSLEENAWLSEHRAEAGIKDEGPEAHHLYWESENGTNTYPTRLARYERFRTLATELGLDAYKGINGSLELERHASLAAYHRYRGDHLAAVRELLDYLDLDFRHPAFREELAAYARDLTFLRGALKATVKAAAGRGGPWRARAESALAAMRDRARIEAGPEGLRLRWGRAEPGLAELEALARRAALFLRLDAGERAGDRVPACAR